MRRIKSILVVFAMLVVLAASAAPAMADDWGEDCQWYWSPWWGWIAACDQAPWYNSGWGHSGWDDLSWDDIGSSYDDEWNDLSWNDIGY